MRTKKEEALVSYQDHQLLYCILTMNAFYQEIPLFLDQKKRKYRVLMQQVSENNLQYFNEFHGYWKFINNFYKTE